MFFLEASPYLDQKTSNKINFYFKYMMNLLLPIVFDNRNRNQNISGTTYRSDLCLYAKQMGEHHITARIKHRSIFTDGDIKENMCRICIGTLCIVCHLVETEYCLNPNSTNSSVQQNLRLDYILTQLSTPPTHHHKLSVVVVNCPS